MVNYLLIIYLMPVLAVVMFLIRIDRNQVPVKFTNEGFRVQIY